MAAHLLRCDFAHVHHHLHDAVVLGMLDQRTVKIMINSGVAHMSPPCTALMYDQHGACGPHLAFFPVLLLLLTNGGIDMGKGIGQKQGHVVQVRMDEILEDGADDNAGGGLSA